MKNLERFVDSTEGYYIGIAIVSLLVYLAYNRRVFYFGILLMGLLMYHFADLIYKTDFVQLDIVFTYLPNLFQSRIFGYFAINTITFFMLMIVASAAGRVKIPENDKYFKR
ncbi:hypothetical protein [Brucella gallinifaecis]|uniref:hypothetical protein n=1 Tax=Brucella gallinifaecis TaxID=215590 RepID=UPI00235E6BB7|nr:hypothetical protein [Brucella gallinifaecis]